jgi:CDP-glucose 4,6-dehydratase
LNQVGCEVFGYSLEPETTPNLFSEAEVGKLVNGKIADIRNFENLREAIVKFQPDLVLHLAAQPLVRRSYRIPRETFEVNAQGTANVLEAIRGVDSIKGVLCITTDKVYKNFETDRQYVETDELGGDDPYSASKAAADIATQSWIKSFATSPIAIARAGNVIGGGDWAIDRIVPDLVTAYSSGGAPKLRYPDAIRPWQHVLDCLNGYLMLIDQMIDKNLGGEWNFGPDHTDKYSVLDLVNNFARSWGVDSNSKTWQSEDTVQPHEAGYLLLDSSKARTTLGWKDKLDFVSSVDWTSFWFKNQNNENSLAQTEEQIKNFLKL